MTKIITEDEFRAIKNRLVSFSPMTVSAHFHRHLATVTKIAASRDFEHYKIIVRAEHPPIKNSLANRVEDLECRVTVLEESRDRAEKALELNVERS